MKGVRFTKREVEYVRALVNADGQDAGRVRLQFDAKLDQTILAKLEKANERSDSGSPGVDAGALERALIGASRGRVVPVEGGPAYARLSRMATAAGATVESARTVGEWLARQRWLTEPLTAFTVVNKWADWSARARATAAPIGTKEGLGGETNVGQAPPGRRQTVAPGRPKEGLG